MQFPQRLRNHRQEPILCLALRASLLLLVGNIEHMPNARNQTDFFIKTTKYKTTFMPRSGHGPWGS